MTTKTKPSLPFVGSTSSNGTLQEDQANHGNHLSTPMPDSKSPEEAPPYKPATNDHISLNMMQTIKDTPAALKGMSDQAWVEFQEARRRVEAAFRRAQPVPRPAATTAPSDDEIAEVLEPEYGSEYYPSIEAQMSGEGSESPKERPMLSWTSSAEAVRAKPRAGRSTDDETVVRTKSLPTLDRKLRQAHMEAFERFDGPQHASHTVDVPESPQQIRLRKPSVPRVKSKTVEGIFAGPNVTTSKGLPSKAPPVQAATTRTSVHRFMPDEQSTTEQSDKRKLSATLQVVRSRDSVYEVIWEDSLTLQPVEDSEVAPDPEAQTEALLGNKKIDTKLAAWSWGFDPTHIYVYEGVAEDPASHPASKIPAISKYQVPGVKPSSLLLSTDSSTSSEIDTENPPLDDAIIQRRRSSAPAGTLEDFADAVERMGAPRCQPTSTNIIDASRRRELLGRRKPSEAIFEEPHFKDHRDSLMLAHERIFHDDGFDKIFDERVGTGKKSVRVAPEPRVAVLKRCTWNKPLPNFKPTPWNGTPDSSAFEGTKLINNLATKVRTPDRHSIAEPCGDKWLDLSAQESGPVFTFGDTDISPAPRHVNECSEASFLELTPERQITKTPVGEGSKKRSEPATGSTAASRARQAATEKSDQAPRKLSASHQGRRGSHKQSN